jgi:hypothetical protein
MTDVPGATSPLPTATAINHAMLHHLIDDYDFYGLFGDSDDDGSVAAGIPLGDASGDGCDIFVFRSPVPNSRAANSPRPADQPDAAETGHGCCSSEPCQCALCKVARGEFYNETETVTVEVKAEAATVDAAANSTTMAPCFDLDGGDDGDDIDASHDGEDDSDRDVDADSYGHDDTESNMVDAGHSGPDSDADDMVDEDHSGGDADGSDPDHESEGDDMVDDDHSDDGSDVAPTMTRVILEHSDFDLHAGRANRRQPSQRKVIQHTKRLYRLMQGDGT